ncbi:MAG: hypothetical protein O3A95_08280 [Planctomycetota bacterium]|nr:hypothetical protein [Planctomycetota bacterium]
MTTFDLNRFERQLVAKRWLARQVHFFESCKSSNEAAKQLLEGGGDRTSLLCIAWEQTGGRGRKARDWWSGPAGANLAVTLTFKDDRVRPELLGLLGAVALSQSVAWWTPQPEAVAIKWPNDILLHGAKLCGFLGEQPAAGDGTLLLGFGCNLAVAPPADLAPYPTTCLADHMPAGQSCPSVEVFLARWLWNFESGLRRFVLRGPSDFEKAFLENLQRWAPYGVQDPRDERAGPLLEFSASRGLRWGLDSTSEFHPLGWIPTLDPLQP